MTRRHFDHPVPDEQPVMVLGADGQPVAMVINGEAFDPLVEDEALGFDERGQWQLGVFPLLLAAPKAVQLAMRVRQQRLQQGKKPVLRSALDQFSRPQAPAPPGPAAPTSNNPGAPAPAGGGFFARFFQGAPMSTTEDLVLGALRRPQLPQRPHMRRPVCRVRKKGGRVFAYDPNSGEEVEVVGYDDDDGGAELMGADYDQALGADDDFLGGEEGDEDDFLGVDDDLDELMEGAGQDDDDTFAGKEERLQKKLNKLEAKAEKLRDRMDDMRGPLKKIRRKRLNKRLQRILKKVRAARKKLDKARNKRKAEVAKADKSLAAIGLAAAGGAAAGAAAGAGAARLVPTSREGQREAQKMQSPLNNPLQAQQLRKAQAAAGLQGQYRAPAGSGRLLPVPMTQDGTTNPRNALTVPAGGITTAATLFAEDLPYAVVNLVGFLSSDRGTDQTNGAIGLVEDLKIQGSGNLFMHEGPVPAAYYDTEIDRLTSLRAYLTVRSPNQAQVDILATGDNGDVVILTCTAVYDVLYDDSYGTGFPGAYG